METIKTWKIFILTHSMLFWYKSFFWPTPKFWPTPILWTHTTCVKISTYPTHAIFLTHAKILWTHANHTKISTHATHAIFLTHSKILQTHATHAKVWPTTQSHAPTPPMLPTLPTLFSRLTGNMSCQLWTLLILSKRCWIAVATFSIKIIWYCCLAPE